MFLNQITYPTFNGNMGLDVIMIIYQALKPCSFVPEFLFTSSLLIFRQSPKVLQVWWRYHRCHRLASRIWLHQHHAHCCGALSSTSWTVPRTPNPQYVFTCKHFVSCSASNEDIQVSKIDLWYRTHQSLFIPLENYFHQHCTVCVYSDLLYPEILWKYIIFPFMF